MVDGTLIRTALIGLGYAGTAFHTPLLLSLPQLFTICYVVEKYPPDELLRENGVSDKFGAQAKLISDYTEALVDPDVELVSGKPDRYSVWVAIVSSSTTATGTASHPLTNRIL